ncbi:MAG: c-type cytochrome [Armatimonadetes bacterium]|nr:c-type cytochrome [Akkermansiaceae bacterium]
MLRVLLVMGALLGSAHGELLATFSQAGKTDVRVDRIAALHVPPGQPPTPFLEPGKFAVSWNGAIELKERRRLLFSFGGQGKGRLEIDGKEILTEEGALGAAKSERLRLNPGVHEIEVTYESLEDGTSRFQIYWEETDAMPRQTIPPNAYAVELSDEARLGELMRHGRLNFTQQNCAKCHVPAKGFGASPMPETGEIGPILVGAGDRITEEWLRKWIADPKALKPTTHMPQLVDPKTPEGLQKASDLAAYLASSKMGAVAVKEPDASLAKDGGVHFHELGCVACHYPAGEAGKAGDLGRVPLNNVASKFLPGQLAAYLKKPDAYHPFSGMPDFQLSEEEANSLAAFLRAEAQGKDTTMPYEFPAGDAKRGAVVAESLQCGTCHPGLPGAVSKAPGLETIFELDWATKGCIAEEDARPGLPVVNLMDGDRDALLAFSKAGPESLKKDSSAEFAKRQIESKRCLACHSMDDQQSLLNSLHDSTAGLAAHVPALQQRVDQTRPQLTFIGEMLYTSYIESMLAGTAKPRPRPWLGTRMPAFRAHAKPLAEGLSMLHGVAPSGPAKVDVTAGLVEIGKSLVGAQGFACTTCHGIGDQQPTAAFEVGAVNFQLTPLRLREDYYYRWMDHPSAVVPGNKMPKYAEGNRSQRGDVLNGDAGKQYEAIWHYLHAPNQ